MFLWKEEAVSRGEKPSYIAILVKTSGNPKGTPGYGKPDRAVLSWNEGKKPPSLTTTRSRSLWRQCNLVWDKLTSGRKFQKELDSRELFILKGTAKPGRQPMIDHN